MESIQLNLDFTKTEARSEDVSLKEYAWESAPCGDKETEWFSLKTKRNTVFIRYPIF